MSRSCHSATSSRPACRLPRRMRARPVSRSAVIGLRLWGMAELPFWPALEPLLDLAHLGALQVADLGGDSSMVAPTEAQAYRYWAWRSRAITWVAGTGCSPRAVAHVALDGRVDVGVRADRAAQLADGHRLAGGQQPDPVAVGLQRPQRHLGAEGRRLGVHAVGAADHGGVAVLEGPPLERARPARPTPRTSRSAASRSAHDWAVSTTSEEVSP